MNNILKARSHIAFIIGLLLAAIIAISSDNAVQYAQSKTSGKNVLQITKNQTVLAQHDVLEAHDIQNAVIAWQYFERNYNAQTGLVNSVDGFPSTTLWDQSSYLLGLISALKLGVIDLEKFDERMSQVLQTLTKLPLFFDQLPNKVYDTRHLQMTTYNNTPSKTGIGWSALDVARIAVPLNILLYDYPQHSAAAGKILSNWSFERLVKDGVLIGARLHEETGLPEHVQEGRLGYEEYGARAIGLLGLDATVALKYDDYMRLETVEDQNIPIDSRDIALFGAPNYVVSEPYILMAIEFGLDHQAKELTHRIYKAQESRFRNTGQLTAVSEDNINQAPYFIYNTVFANGVAWNAVSESGEIFPNLRTISTKAAFGWDALFKTDYTKRLVDAVQKTQTKDRGWVSGVYENDDSLNDVATANTNGIILEIINYKANGPLISARFKKENKSD
ncbi:DUF3131 domain-containing protein [Amylibacter sp. SFDW26]|uniref:DUF3131 domain-containing protein n=1 Tax=Amylibacter sp. SFDW26 TaxID=2652722 RepID=UPI001261EB12|nr:DUF3131 domain-containing protein [Amylibacter sp. SFDW26]KAB7614674.1 DUF3131 domain-containing protein [Amylibacter sp. SFDW26]